MIVPPKDCSPADGTLFAANHAKRVKIGGKYAIIVHIIRTDSAQNPNSNALMAIGGIASTAATGLGSVTVATITTTAPAWGPLGWLGLTTTVATTIALPVGGVAVVAGAVMWGGYTVYKAMQKQTEYHQVALEFASPTDSLPDCSADCAARVAAIFPELTA